MLFPCACIRSLIRTISISKETLVNVFNILIAGCGQGVLLNSKSLPRQRAPGPGREQSEVHGMAQRGGSVLSQVRFGDQVFRLSSRRRGRL